MEIQDIRLRNLRVLVQLHGGPTRFGDLVGRGQAQISALLGKHKHLGTRLARSMEERAGLKPGWFDTPQFLQDEETTPLARALSVLTPAQVAGMVASGHRPQPALNENDVIGIDAATAERMGPRIYGFRIGFIDAETLYRPGDVVVVDPDRRPGPGDDVLVCIGDTITLRRFRARSPGYELTPYNPDFPTLVNGGSARIAGVVVEHRRTLK